MLQPFDRGSIWNLPIGNGASYISAGIHQATASGGMQADADILVLTPTVTPLTQVVYNGDAWNGGSRCAAQGGALFSAPIPPSFVVPGAFQGSADGTTPNYATAILDTDGRSLFQGQPFARCSTNQLPTIWWYQKNEDIYGTGRSGAHGGSMLSSIGGTIRLGEFVPGGSIPHALKVNLNGDNLNPSGYRWPAFAMDGCAPGCYTGGIKMGSLLALDSSFSFASLETSAGNILATTFTNYGGYVVDNSGWSVYGLSIERSPSGQVRDEFQTKWGFSFDPPNKNTPWARDIDRIFLALKVINNWDATTWNTVSASNGALGAGLGSPKVPWALALDTGAPPQLPPNPPPNPPPPAPPAPATPPNKPPDLPSAPLPAPTPTSRGGNPFSDLQQAITNISGMDFTLSGLFLGFVLTIAVFIILESILSRRNSKGDSTILWSGGLGIGIAFAVGWFPIYMPIFVGIIVVFIMIGPFSNRR